MSTIKHVALQVFELRAKHKSHEASAACLLGLCALCCFADQYMSSALPSPCSSLCVCCAQHDSDRQCRGIGSSVPLEEQQLLRQPRAIDVGSAESANKGFDIVGLWPVSILP